ncbi:group III truncated hemoglobin [Flavobacterium nackdongense]|uniref:Group III truncated hemoglobin n=1 Tax=Flavobacterium nackdongense TaxID=2547394 RepID=A0A4P6YD64_9FLAO|nr:group III truncated hemoglobin [Flavobacterium nackdongense]QBN18617.1 group III truncated hemoglobin [Flavobacterium nackdongense]
MKTDIKNRADIERLVYAFYLKIKADKTISYFFDEVAQVEWEKHTPKVCDFFENILFYSGNYEGNPMVTHEKLSQKSKVTAAHFNLWNHYFISTVDELFVGVKAEEIKERAIKIAAAMMYKTLA